MKRMTCMKPRIIGALSVLVFGAVLGDSAAANTPRVAPEQLHDYWTLKGSSWDAWVPNYGQNLDKPGCVAVAYSIGADGVTRDVRAVRTVPRSDLDKVAVSLVKNFRYEASENNTHDLPVRTYYIVPFNVKQLPKPQHDKVVAACKLPGYGH